VRSAAVGLLVGIVPGVGGSVAQFVSYNTTVMAAKDKSRFGKGAVDGLISSEAAVNAKEGGQLFPTLLFGIPGSAEMAIVLAAWQIHGLNPGPFFLRDYGVLAWALIFGLVVSNVISGLFAMSISTKLSKVRSFDIAIVSCVVLVFTVVAVYIIRQNVLDILAVIAFGIVGLYMKGYGYSVIGVVIGFVLGSVVEENWNLTIQSNYNSYMGFFNSTTSLVLATLTALTVLAILYLYGKTEINKRRGNHG
jgi:putative tricarboxylic transport membrane protein